jgi:hypothetical protein
MARTRVRGYPAAAPSNDPSRSNAREEETMRLGLPFLLLSLVTPLSAQEYHFEQNDALGIRYRVLKKLKAIPLKLGESQPNLRARFEPMSEGDYVHGRLGKYAWYLNVLEFPKAAPTTGPKQAQSVKEMVEAEVNKRFMAQDFKEFASAKDPSIQNRTFAIKEKEVKKSGKVPMHLQWQYSDVDKDEGDELTWYSVAGVYDFPARQIALVATAPVTGKHDKKPKDTLLKWLQTMVDSVEPVEAKDPANDAEDAAKEKYADTAEKQVELGKAKANIANMKGWDFFTMPHYIVLYSWDPERADKRRPAYMFAKDLVDKLEDVRTLYEHEYPPHEKMLHLYSILRVCNNLGEFMKYGDSPRGVVGWFSPHSKELVVFDDKDKYFGDKDMVATTFHEGWHQYANTYFSDDVELHRWFDEGTGDYFGSFSRRGSSWVYTVDKGRRMGILEQVRRGDYVPLRDIVRWNKDKFYGPRAVDYYAEAYSFIDFLHRGPEVLGKRFDPSWANILDNYRQTMLTTKNQDKAVDKAFQGVDFDGLEAAWIDWVKNHLK